MQIPHSTTRLGREVGEESSKYAGWLGLCEHTGQQGGLDRGLGPTAGWDSGRTPVWVLGTKKCMLSTQKCCDGYRSSIGTRKARLEGTALEWLNRKGAK